METSLHSHYKEQQTKTKARDHVVAQALVV